ncbi:MAG: hypothetical protein EOM20_03930 [Spartobacteria bacterium]|nr:hypothetical protein [Spartobacteria bacterium]
MPQGRRESAGALSTGHDNVTNGNVGVACVGAAGDGGGGQRERSVEVAKPHRPGGRGVLCAGFGDERWHHR